MTFLGRDLDSGGKAPPLALVDRDAPTWPQVGGSQSTRMATTPTNLCEYTVSYTTTFAQSVTPHRHYFK